MKIFGHRGAAGVSLENSRDSLLVSLQYETISAVEFDVHRTKDGHLVVIHDHTTGRVAEKLVCVHDVTLAELRMIRLRNGQTVMTLDELFEITGSKKPVMVDIKDPGCADALVALLERHPNITAYATSFEHDNLVRLREVRPDVPTYILDHGPSVKMVRLARQMHATGISVNKWAMNPLTYVFARKHGLDVLIYTVNWRWFAHLLHWLYPSATLYTDYPERLTPRR